MPEPMSDRHYEEQFVFPLWRLIEQRAEEKDISYRAAAREVIPEYTKTIRYGDREFEEGVIWKYEEDTRDVESRWNKLIQGKGKGEAK
jgi:hypothetical protein